MSEALEFQKQKISLLTKHGKESIIGPILARGMDKHVELITAYDTDLLGTFDRTVDRKGSQLDAARKKAHLAIVHSSNHLGIASEGSFVQDPFTGLMPWNIELVVLVDVKDDVEVVGMAQGNAVCLSRLVSNLHELLQFADESQFPSHHLMMRPESLLDPRVKKGIKDLKSLREIFLKLRSLSSNGKVFVENDLRAFCNPTRQRLIAQATEDLVKKMSSFCPNCKKPGFWKTKAVPGRSCSGCGSPTSLPIAEMWSCSHCKHQERHELKDLLPADPYRCHVCNP